MTSALLIDNRLEVKVVTCAAQQSDAMLVRAICFADGETLPLKSIVDGNDYQATHFVAYIDDEPVGSARVRWFRDFAKFERSCLTQPYRNARSIYTIARTVFAHIEQKGFDKVVTYANPKFAKIWCRLLGFEVVGGKKPFLSTISNEPYFELVKELSAHPSTINLASPAAIMERVEGFWQTPVSYEKE